MFVQKTYGSLRLCIDYHGLNGITRKDACPLPRVHDTLDEVKMQVSTLIWIWRMGFGNFESLRKMITRQHVKLMMDS
jgi:hypothetical protein